MKISDQSLSFCCNDLWRYIAFDLCRKYQTSSECSTEGHLAVMSEILQIWKNRSGMRLLLCTRDRSTGLFVDGTSKGATIRMVTSDFTWEVLLEDRKWIFGRQIVRLMDVLKYLEGQDIEFKIQ